jgi:hypothetical protein
MDESNVLQSIRDIIIFASSQDGSQPQNDDLVGMANQIGCPVGYVNPKWSKRLPADEFEKVVGSHHTFS